MTPLRTWNQPGFFLIASCGTATSTQMSAIRRSTRSDMVGGQCTFPAPLPLEGGVSYS